MHIGVRESCAGHVVREVLGLDALIIVVITSLVPSTKAISVMDFIDFFSLLSVPLR